MKRWLALFFTLIQIIFITPAHANSNALPTPHTSIYVQDYANILSTQSETYINKLGAELNEKTKAQITVVTVPTLNDEDINTYALNLFRNWGIGDKTKNNGVLMLIAVKDRQSRIEVGYGLEGALPDGLTGKIQDKYMLPYFKKGDYNTGIVNGYIVLNQLAAKEYNVKIDYKKYLNNTSTRTENSSNATSAFDNLSPLVKVLIIVGLIAFFIIDAIFFGGFFFRNLLLILALFFRGGGRGGGFGGGSFGGGSSGGGGSNRSW